MLFRLLALRGIFRHSAVPQFHLFRIWGHFPPFRDSTILLFHRSVIPAFRVSPSKGKVVFRAVPDICRLQTADYRL